MASKDRRWVLVQNDVSQAPVVHDFILTPASAFASSSSSSSSSSAAAAASSASSASAAAASSASSASAAAAAASVVGMDLGSCEGDGCEGDGCEGHDLQVEKLKSVLLQDRGEGREGMEGNPSNVFNFLSFFSKCLGSNAVLLLDGNTEAMQNFCSVGGIGGGGEEPTSLIDSTDIWSRRWVHLVSSLQSPSIIYKTMM